jgi:hypothetical protein
LPGDAGEDVHAFAYSTSGYTGVGDEWQFRPPRVRRWFEHLSTDLLSGHTLA